MKKRTVVYIGNANCYHMMKLAAKSLLAHARVDRIYFLIDDEKFPVPLPDAITCIDVRDQPFFPDGCPNVRDFYGYVTLLRSVLSKILDEDEVLLLDPDTLVEGPIGGLFETNLDGYCFGAVRETRNSYHELRPYYNAGVMLMNLKRLRETGMDDRIIQALNERWFLHLEQDALNELCRGQILDLPSDFSASFVTEETYSPRIVHFLSYDKRYFIQEAKRYSRMTWEAVLRCAE